MAEEKEGFVQPALPEAMPCAGRSLSETQARWPRMTGSGSQAQGGRGQSTCAPARCACLAWTLASPLSALCRLGQPLPLSGPGSL